MNNISRLLCTQKFSGTAEQVKETSNKKTTAKAQATSKKDDSKTVKAEVKDNVVAKSELARVKDQDKNLQMEGKNDRWNDVHSH